MAADRIIQRRWKRWLIASLAILLGIYTIYLVREIWLPLAIAFLIAMTLDPVVDRMELRGFSRFWASLMIFVSFFVFLVATLYVIIPPVVRQAQYVNSKLNEYIPDKSPAGFDKFLAENNVSSSVRPLAVRAFVGLNRAGSRSIVWLSEHGLEIASNLIWLVIIPIVSFYALKDFHLILAKTLLVVPKEKRDFVQTMMAEVTAVFAKYIRGLVFVSTLNGIATWLLLELFRVPGALLLGLIAGLIYGVPYFGAIATVIITAGVCIISGGLGFALLVTAASVILHQVVFDQLVTPRVLGSHVGLHPILAIISLLVGNALFGLFGMLIAVPVAACIQIAVLAVVPKLNYEVDLSSAGTEETREISEETKEEHLSVSASDELHHAVTTAVEHIDAQAKETGT